MWSPEQLGMPFIAQKGNPWALGPDDVAAMRAELEAKGVTFAIPGSEALKQLDRPTCVASSSTPESLRRKLTHVGLYENFTCRIFSAVEVPNGKPAPDLFLYAAERMGVAPSRCVVAEDSRYGVLAARAAGMHVFAFASGFVGPETLQGPETTLFSDMSELPSPIDAYTKPH